jgi:Smg-4/UPF3 family
MNLISSPHLAISKAKQNVFSRAYFHFLTMEAVLNFHQGFDGHLFIDGKGKPLLFAVQHTHRSCIDRKP